MKSTLRLVSWDLLNREVDIKIFCSLYVTTNYLSNEQQIYEIRIRLLR